ncbi:ABC transporter ATP-binding protein [Brucella anthropi]|jgi:NitT/TauT family transport system ATP-binding protein|uniref:ABC transporter ATP-binding protein n=2 Tax=Brucella TaxID=234 RepID=A0A011T3A3_BRUAN|nr:MULTISPECIES: ABC transporter ATP-binding protein [Brucella/Ochrobactrum group]MCR5941895.1 ABC transporter ATP-binding protein [Ochrobactrum sp. XJ1]QOD65482.1 ABC transporter ATP-binding protein [Ochrobactrum sp. MT180101]QTN04978.1 ATP-binding cassette domain-containing protein [Ochrobactrum sp. EEELCW01]EXL06094.1 nitrate ABC transporter ATP-binding protein [Brucella anthropi]KAB2740321.1 ABC transporter ATP-binding protein [Brucella anthropi]
MSAEPSRIQPEETRKTAIALKDVQISFKLADGGRFDAVAESNLEVAENEFVAIVGPTGCGKSTLLNAVAGLLVPASGTVEISGQRLQGLNRKAGYLFQQDALMPWKTVLDNVSIGLEIAGTSKAQAREQAREWLGRVGLASFGDRYPHMLSGGQRKRVGLAQVLIRNPKYLLMDEPFGPLDAQTRVIMGDLLLDLWSQDKKAVMFVTHDLEEAIALADRVVIMSAGPRARIMAEYKIPLARPREISEIRLDDKFHEIHREIWSALKEEVLKGYQQTSGEKK